MSFGFEIKFISGSRGKKLEFVLAVPDSSSKGMPLKAMLALPPGDQSLDEVMVFEPWLSHFVERGWLICSPIAPDGKLFFRDSERYLPTIMDQVESQLEIAGGKFFLVGISNGGISAFRVGTLNPERFHSITVIPGWPKPVDEQRLDVLTKIPINFLVGELDSRWRLKAEQFSDRISKLGGDSHLEIVPGGDHMVFRDLRARNIEQIIQRNVS